MAAKKKSTVSKAKSPAKAKATSKKEPAAEVAAPAATVESAPAAAPKPAAKAKAKPKAKAPAKAPAKAAKKSASKAKSAVTAEPVASAEAPAAKAASPKAKPKAKAKAKTKAKPAAKDSPAKATSDAKKPAPKESEAAPSANDVIYPENSTTLPPRVVAALDAGRSAKQGYDAVAAKTKSAPKAPAKAVEPVAAPGSPAPAAPAPETVAPTSGAPVPLGEEFGPEEDYLRTRRLNEPSNKLMWFGRKMVDLWESAMAKASPHGDPGVYDAGQFQWTNKLEANWKVIRKELEGILDRRADLPSFHEIIKEVSTITTDNDWKTFFLYAPGMDCAGNRAKCPETTKLVEGIPGMKTAMFSILSPRKHIPAHRGPYAGVLRYHLGLIVPEPREKCRIRIGNKAYNWSEGKSLVFDDSFNHEVWNDTDGVRVVLFVDFLRPLHWPHDWINRAGMEVATFAPFIRAANAAQKQWEAQFYKKKEG